MISKFCEKGLTDVPMSDVQREYEKLLSPQSARSSKEAASAVDKFVERRTDVELALHTNQLTSLPSAVGELRHLVSLFCHKNRLASLPEQLCNLKALTCLSLNDNLFSAVPACVFELPMLSQLYLSNNRLASLGTPEQFGRLSKLTLLTCANNLLDELPDVALPLLRKLACASNRLVALPASLGDCDKLLELDVEENQLRCLPPQLGKLDPNIVLKLDGNPLMSPPPQILKLKTKQVIGFLRDLLVDAEHVMVCKVLVVGQENVGKTTLVKAIKHARSSSKLSKLARRLTSRKELSTDGIDVIPVALDYYPLESDAAMPGALRAVFYDFAGQEVYYASHQFFMSARSLVLLVWNLSEPATADRCLFWLKSIVARAGKRVPVILVGTHADARICTPAYIDAEQNRVLEMLEPFVEQIRAMHSVVALDDADDDVAQLIDNIGRYASRVPQVGAPLPASYIALECVAAAAAAQPDAVPVRSWKAWRRLARVAGIERVNAAPSPSASLSSSGVPATPRTSVRAQRRSTLGHGSSAVDLLAASMTDDDADFETEFADDVDDDALKRATTALHLLGSVVWFDDDVLQDLVILSTQWLSDAISTVLTTKHRLVKDGVIEAHSLPLIWKPPQFPARLHTRLLALLSQFELLHPLDATRFLVPSLLPAASDANRAACSALLDARFSLDVDARDAARRFERRFRLDFVPHGLFSRLLVRVMRFLPMQQFWHGGFVLDDGKGGRCVALLDGDGSGGGGGGDVLRVVVVGVAVVPLLEDVVDTFVTLCRAWYTIELEATAPCPHCISAKAPSVSQFRVADIDAVIAENGSSVVCSQRHQVPLSLLTPDLLLQRSKATKDDVEIAASDVVLGAEIAHGGFGTVYAATFRGVAVAVKKLNMRPDERVALFQEFRNEVRFMTRLRHPNIVSLLGFCADPPMLVLELLAGGDLYVFLHDASNAVGWRLRVVLWRDIARGLAYLHGTKPATLHRDLKSPNILMLSADADSDARCKVSDFGTSLRASGAVREDANLRTVGNPTWLSPEVLSGRAHAEAADVYAFGVIGWELLTREHPFAHLNSAFQFELEDAIRSGARPPLPRGAPKRYAALVRSCWHQSPSTRPTAAQIVSILDGVAVAPGSDESPGWMDEPRRADAADDADADADAADDNDADPLQAEQFLRTEQHESAPDRSLAARFLLKRVSNPAQALTAALVLSAYSQLWVGTVKGAVLVFDLLTMQQIATKPASSAPIDALVEGANSRCVWVLSRRRRLALAFSAPDLNKPSPFAQATEPVVVDVLALKQSHRKASKWSHRYLSVGGGFLVFAKKQGHATAAAAPSRSTASPSSLNSSTGTDEEDGAVSLVNARVAAVNHDSGEHVFCIVVRSSVTGKEYTFDFQTEARRDSFLHCLRVGVARDTGALHGLQGLLELSSGALAGACNGRELWLFQADGVVTVSSDGQVRARLEVDAGQPHASLLLARSAMWVGAGTSIRLFKLDDRKPLSVLRGHAAPITALALVAGETVWSGDSQGAVRAWSLASLQCVREVRAAASVPVLSLYRVGRFVAASIGSRVWVMSASGATAPLELRRRHDEKDTVCAVMTFQQNASLVFLVACSSDESIVTWVLNAQEPDALNDGRFPISRPLQRRQRFESLLSDQVAEAQMNVKP